MCVCALLASSPVPDYVKATVETVMKIHETEDDGDVLAFLTGQVRDDPKPDMTHDNYTQHTRAQTRREYSST